MKTNFPYEMVPDRKFYFLHYCIQILEENYRTKQPFESTLILEENNITTTYDNNEVPN